MVSFARIKAFFLRHTTQPYHGYYSVAFTRYGTGSDWTPFAVLSYDEWGGYSFYVPGEVDGRRHVALSLFYQKLRATNEYRWPGTADVSPAAFLPRKFSQAVAKGAGIEAPSLSPAGGADSWPRVPPVSEGIAQNDDPHTWVSPLGTLKDGIAAHQLPDLYLDACNQLFKWNRSHPGHVWTTNNWQA